MESLTVMEKGHHQDVPRDEARVDRGVCSSWFFPAIERGYPGDRAWQRLSPIASIAAAKKSALKRGHKLSPGAQSYRQWRVACGAHGREPAPSSTRPFSSRRLTIAPKSRPRVPRCGHGGRSVGRTGIREGGHHMKQARCLRSSWQDGDWIALDLLPA